VSCTLPPLTPHTLLTRRQLGEALQVGRDEVRRLWRQLPRQLIPGRSGERWERVKFGDVEALMVQLQPEQAVGRSVRGGQGGEHRQRPRSPALG
jgi:hypothetical protein